MQAQEEFRKNRIRAMLAPVILAGKALTSFEALPVRLVAEIATKQPKAASLGQSSGFTDFRTGLVETASIVGATEQRSSDDMLRDVASHLGITDPDLGKETLLLEIARKSGVECQRGPPLLMLETIGRRLGLPPSDIFDRNAYFNGAERYWAWRLAQKFGVRTAKNDEELLTEAAKKLGVPLSLDDEKKVGGLLRQIARHLDVSDKSNDDLTIISLIHTRLLTLPTGRRIGT